jgi:hypothetical protein
MTPADVWSWNRDNLGDAYRAAMDPQTWRDAADAYGQALLAGSTAPGFRAFHGSPHSFDRFDLGRIGTGEGAQVYGRGLYFADREGTAQAYRDALAGRGQAVMVVGGKAIDRPPYEELSPQSFAYDALDAMNGDPVAAKGYLRRQLKLWMRPGANLDTPAMKDIINGYQNAHDVVDDWAQQGIDWRRGHMYEVNINADPEQMLHWDKPWAEQTPHVQQALTDAGLAPMYRAEPSATGKTWSVVHRGGWVPNAAQSYYRTEAAARADAERLQAATSGRDYAPMDMDAMQRLRQAGIPGLRYLDAGSRGGGEGTHNTVVFDDKLIDVLRKYGVAGLFVAGGAAAAGGQPQQ